MSYKGVGSKCPMCREDVNLLRFIFKIDFINFLFNNGTTWG